MHMGTAAEGLKIQSVVVVWWHVSTHTCVCVSTCTTSQWTWIFAAAALLLTTTTTYYYTRLLLLLYYSSRRREASKQAREKQSKKQESKKARYGRRKLRASVVGKERESGFLFLY
jgi:hypothetical protein